ncbi:uncharacterized protein SCODWIG_02399 [Saccharomycodes ludwigii]|uniref:Uncharacterized protein n=1 Tax=Saccharomycodes ludwigii TaxID=36035 RepID=A0A376B7J7_9ASCO|nr:hypothetical protein SCDLUD_004066 [Saccharomycodes ludwigii]KAH3899776.1 hypothetical protein SCDLUD_004066 [Saccharomycodes ludwigii]SSD60638.1 uncharacterized protein SCODWIG_02399 [Saccharomycodes ludwigii]
MPTSKSLLLLLLVLSTSHFANAWRDVVMPRPKDTTTTEAPKPWVRTIYDSAKEIVTPTVIAGITFSAEPDKESDPLKPWVSLKKDGSPVTIKPEIKNGRTKNAYPSYSTYFQNVYTTSLTYEDLGKPQNMDPDDIFEKEIFVDDDDTYTSLNPVMRCTPLSYFQKGPAKNILSEPFCSPREKTNLKVDDTYFITWYTKFFTHPVTEQIAEKVRLHFTYVKEDARDKNLHKRNPEKATFFITEWLNNVDGIFPLEVQEAWLQGQAYRAILVTIQPDYINDDEFLPSTADNGLEFIIKLGSKVFKTTKEQLALQDAGIYNDSIYYIILAIPMCVVVTFVGMYFFLYLTKGNRDFSDIKSSVLKSRHRVIGRIKDIKKFRGIKNHKYEELPQFKKVSKQN